MPNYFPIIYVRGYAMTDSEVESTFNNPYYGFNLGSTQYKLSAAADPKMHIFESPVIRLMKDEVYRDSFNRYVDSENRPIAGSIPADDADWRRTLWIFRFYDPESEIFNGQDRPKIEGYASDLAIFLNQIRLACGDPQDFAVNLVAHSMGGLISRCYLQNGDILDGRKLAEKRADERGIQLPSLQPVEVRKFFTFGTPHKGITFRTGLGWAEDIRDLIGYTGSDTFGPGEMRRYLKLADGEDLHTYDPLPHAPPIKSVFSLVGTNYEDYVVRASRLGVGPGSDGLVAIENAYVKGGPRAVVHRAHSGPLGIVNSEAGYQNLRRFLFGDGRFKLFLRLGPFNGDFQGLQDADDELEYFLAEVNLTIRGLPSYIHTRSAEHLSALTIKVAKHNGGYTPADGDTHLYTGYLRSEARLSGDDFARGAADLRLEPHFLHDGWIRDSRYEGDWLMNDRLRFGLKRNRDAMTLVYRWNSQDEESPENSSRELFIPLPERVQKFFPEGGIRFMFDEWQ